MDGTLPLQDALEERLRMLDCTPQVNSMTSIRLGAIMRAQAVSCHSAYVQSAGLARGWSGALLDHNNAAAGCAQGIQDFIRAYPPSTRLVPVRFGS